MFFSILTQGVLPLTFWMLSVNIDCSTGITVSLTTVMWTSSHSMWICQPVAGRLRGLPVDIWRYCKLSLVSPFQCPEREKKRGKKEEKRSWCLVLCFVKNMLWCLLFGSVSQSSVRCVPSLLILHFQPVYWLLEVVCVCACLMCLCVCVYIHVCVHACICRCVWCLPQWLFLCLQPVLLTVYEKHFVPLGRQIKPGLNGLLLGLLPGLEEGAEYYDRYTVMSVHWQSINHQ